MNDDGAAHVVKSHGPVHGAGSPIEGCNAPETRPGKRVLSIQLERGLVGVASNSRAVCHRQMRGLCAGVVLRPVAPFRCHG